MQAMQRRELKVYYQPKIDATTSRMKSAEALIRWVKEDGSIVLPNQFLSSMEQTGAIAMLDWYVVEKVCLFLERLKELNIEPVPISVNFSRWHLREEDMPKHLAEIVDSHHLDHRLIIVEITESTMIQEEELMKKTVKELHENGFEFSVDDFGSGLSSLSLVADTLPDEIKIDRSLLKKNCEDERERIILDSIFLFANRLNIRTVAEGVETKEQLGFLRTCNCNLIQGFYFFQPMTEDDFIQCLNNQRAHLEEEDILQIQSETSALQLLLHAIYMRYPLIIYGNLTRNSFYMMTYENFTSKSCPSTGTVDDLISHGTSTMHPEDQKRWSAMFCRENQLKLYREGKKEFHMITRQIGDDGIYRKVETSNYFVKSPMTDDVLVISLCNNFVSGEE
ncbi:MAG: EAL domain-containing protein [Clostridia bacterium]|nr:EAL domain-containing protein [Clostridia bacterium]